MTKHIKDFSDDSLRDIYNTTSSLKGGCDNLLAGKEVDTTSSLARRFKCARATASEGHDSRKP